jgi:hypothetical protein
VIRLLVTVLSSEVGREEVALALGMCLIAYGFWDVWRPASFVIPGVVMVWVTLPSRTPFVERSDQPDRRRAE